MYTGLINNQETHDGTENTNSKHEQNSKRDSRAVLGLSSFTSIRSKINILNSIYKRTNKKQRNKFNS